jgi:hypothetical protein
VSGGGGDLVASEVRVNNLPKKDFNTVANPLRSTSEPRKVRRRRLSKEGRSPCQPGFFKPFCSEDQSLRAAKNRQEKREACPLFRYRTIRLERGDYVDCVTEARSFLNFSSPVEPKDFRLKLLRRPARLRARRRYT